MNKLLNSREMTGTLFFIGIVYLVGVIKPNIKVDDLLPLIIGGVVSMMFTSKLSLLIAAVLTVLCLKISLVVKEGIEKEKKPPPKKKEKEPSEKERQEAETRVRDGGRGRGTQKAFNKITNDINKGANRINNFFRSSDYRSFFEPR